MCNAQVSHSAGHLNCLQPQDYCHHHTCNLTVKGTMVPSQEGFCYFAVFPLYSHILSKCLDFILKFSHHLLFVGFQTSCII
jgi:hypothetical protein